METFQLEDNCYATVASLDQETFKEQKIPSQSKKDGNKKIIACMILLFAAVFALLLGIAGACIGFTLELLKLQNEIQTFQQLNASIDMLSQTSRQQNSFITAHELNSSIDMLYQILNQHNGLITAHELNSSINMLQQQLNLQNETILFAYQQLNSNLTSIKMLYQILNQQNDFITAHELNSSNVMLYQHLNLQNESIQFAFQQLNRNLTQELNSGIDQLHEVNSSINQLDVVISNRLDSILDRLELLELYTPQPQCGDGFWKQVAHIT